ncbi:MAG: ammonium transporter, partial [Candidatus Marinimicrobia bacterium]|nr:ammonium transporter [Candidatus Neomarinimicrobiota bacterium]
VGIFSAEYSLGIQVLGVLTYGAFCFVSATIIFQTIKLIIGLRVSEEEEILGLDIGEHDMESYAGFQIFTVE